MKRMESKVRIKIWYSIVNKVDKEVIDKISNNVIKECLNIFDVSDVIIDYVVMTK